MWRSGLVGYLQILVTAHATRRNPAAWQPLTADVHQGASKSTPSRNHGPRRQRTNKQSLHSAPVRPPTAGQAARTTASKMTMIRLTVAQSQGRQGANHKVGT